MHMLNQLQVCHGQLYKSEQSLKVLFRALVKFIRDSPSLVRELGPISTKNDTMSQKAYDYFCYLSYTKHPIVNSHKMPFGEEIASTYLQAGNHCTLSIGR